MLCFLDLETTGINQFLDQPIEIGALLVSNDLKIINKFHSYIALDKQLKFSESSKKTHGLEESFLDNMPNQKEVLTRFFNEFNTKFRFVSWNMSFDIGFFRRISYENGFINQFEDINYRHIDLQSMFYFYCQVKNISNLYSLSDACSYFGINRSKYHNAFEDAKIAYEIYIRLIDSI